jgi:hypothetical protein
MWDAKYALAAFEEKTGLKVEKVFEHRSVEWSAGEKENLLVLKVSGKAHPAFVVFDSSGIRKWGYIIPCAKYGLTD